MLREHCLFQRLCKNWIDPFEGIETQSFLCFLNRGRITVRIELTRLRGLRHFTFFHIIKRIYSCKNWIDPLEGIETFQYQDKHLFLSRLCKNWIDPLEGIETTYHLYRFYLGHNQQSKNWIDPLEGIETLPNHHNDILYCPPVRIELTRLRGLRLYVWKFIVKVTYM